MMDITEVLKQKARAAAIAGYYSWRDAMLISAKEIEWLRQELEAANAACDFLHDLASDTLAKEKVEILDI